MCDNKILWMNWFTYSANFLVPVYDTLKEWWLLLLKGTGLNSATTLASQPAAGHSLSLFITIVIMTLGWGLLVELAAESCGQILLPCLTPLSNGGIQTNTHLFSLWLLLSYNNWLVMSSPRNTLYSSSPTSPQNTGTPVKYTKTN